jgi:hypothetical protein
VPVPPPAVEAATEVPKLWELERLVATQPHDDAFVQAERETTLFAIREYAAVDGTIPPQFHMLVDDVFGELIART